MSTDASSNPANTPDSATPRLFGYRGRIVGEPHIEAWIPDDEATVDGRPPLPEPPPRGWTSQPQPRPPAEAEAPPAEVATGPVAAPAKPAQPPPKPVPPPVVRKSVSPRRETPHDKQLSRTQQMVRERPEDAAKLVRTMLLKESQGGGGV